MTSERWENMPCTDKIIALANGAGFVFADNYGDA